MSIMIPASIVASAALPWLIVLIGLNDQCRKKNDGAPREKNVSENDGGPTHRPPFTEQAEDGKIEKQQGHKEQA
ncbi:MAG: hypothetical protein H6556_15065 [Lewinellaceae bacterium]|nr:hypothetical protein [Lewinellaceae bacterium]